MVVVDTLESSGKDGSEVHPDRIGYGGSTTTRGRRTFFDSRTGGREEGLTSLGSQ